MVMRLARGNTECNAVFPVMSVQTVSQQLLELEKALPGPVPAILGAAAVPVHRSDECAGSWTASKQ